MNFYTMSIHSAVLLCFFTEADLLKNKKKKKKDEKTFSSML